MKETKGKSYLGDFWFPSKPERKVRGKLIIDDSNKSSLQTDGALEGNTSDDINSFPRSPKPDLVIWGELDAGGVVTLFDVIHSSGHTSPFRWERYQATYNSPLCVMGGHFSLKSDLKVRVLKLYFTNLREWICFSPFDYSIHKKGEDIVKIKHWHEEQFRISTSIDFCIQCGISQTAGPLEFRAEILAWVALVSTDSLTLDEWSPHVNSFQRLLIFASSKRSIVEKLHAFPITQNEDELNIFMQVSLRNVEKLTSREFLFSWDDILSDRRGEFLSKWFTLNTDFEQVVSLYISSIIWKDSSQYHVFQVLVQAIEAFHRGKFDRPRVPKGEFRVLCDEVRKTISQVKDDEWKSRFATAVSNTNTLSLRERIEELLNKYSIGASALIDNNDKFAMLISKTRNFLAHRGDDQDFVIHERDIFWFNEAMRHLLQIAILVELGYVETDAVSMIREHSLNHNLKKSLRLTSEKYFPDDPPC